MTVRCELQDLLQTRDYSRTSAGTGAPSPGHSMAPAPV